MTSSLNNIDIHDEIEQSKWSFPFNEFSLYSNNFSYRDYVFTYVSMFLSVSFKIERKTNMWSVVQFKSFSSNKVVRQETPYYTFFQLGATKFIFEFYPFSGNL